MFSATDSEISTAIARRKGRRSGTPSTIPRSNCSLRPDDRFAFGGQDWKAGNPSSDGIVTSECFCVLSTTSENQAVIFFPSSMRVPRPIICVNSSADLVGFART